MRRRVILLIIVVVVISSLIYVINFVLIPFRVVNKSNCNTFHVSAMGSPGMFRATVDTHMRACVRRRKGWGRSVTHSRTLSLSLSACDLAGIPGTWHRVPGRSVIIQVQSRVNSAVSSLECCEQHVWLKICPSPPFMGQKVHCGVRKGPPLEPVLMQFSPYQCSATCAPRIFVRDCIFAHYS